MKGISSKSVRNTEIDLQAVIDQVESIKQVAIDYKEQRSENWCESEAGEAYENKIEQLEELVDSLNAALEEFVDLMEGD